MKKGLLAVLLLGLSVNSFAAEIDLESVMKEMRSSYRLAEKANSVSEMQQAMTKLEAAVEKAKTGDYAPQRDAVYQEGYQKLTDAFKGIEHSLAQGDLQQAKSQLKDVDALKKQYHKAAKKLK